MVHCLGIPEILRLVCNGVDKKSSLAIGLACRAFLEPALDRIWHELTSFQPLIHCLPDGLLIEDDEDGASLSLLRTLTAKDLERYLTTYARRIQSFALSPNHKFMSLGLDVLSALQLVTEYQPGALSPCLQHFEWPSPQLVYWLAPSIELMSPQLSLFLGDSVQRLRVEWNGEEYPLYTGFLTFSTGRLSNVKELELLNRVEKTAGYITSFPWSSLEKITIKNDILDKEYLCSLSRLPQLRSLKFDDDIGELAELSFVKDVVQAASDCRSNPASFASLRSLAIDAFYLGSADAVLQFLPKENKLERVELTAEFSSLPLNGQQALDAVYEYCNPLHLNVFQCYDCRAPSPVDEETIEFEDEDEEDVDIWTLCKFTALTELRIRCGGQIAFYPRDIPRLAYWPHLQYFDICSMQYSYGGMPPVDHTHLFEILQECPSLRYLGLRFDASQLKAEEEEPHQSFKLHTLRVGESPIRSPARVARFIKLLLPSLKELDATYITPKSFERPNMLDKRWTEVAKLVL